MKKPLISYKSQKAHSEKHKRMAFAKQSALEKKKGMSKEQMKHIKDGNLGGFMRTYLK